MDCWIAGLSLDLFNLLLKFFGHLGEEAFAEGFFGVIDLELGIDAVDHGWFGFELVLEAGDLGFKTGCTILNAG